MIKNKSLLLTIIVAGNLLANTGACVVTDELCSPQSQERPYPRQLHKQPRFSQLDEMIEHLARLESIRAQIDEARDALACLKIIADATESYNQRWNGRILTPNQQKSRLDHLEKFNRDLFRHAFYKGFLPREYITEHSDLDNH